MRRFGVLLLVMTAVLAASAGCGGGSGAPAPPAGQLKIEPAWTSCAAEAPTPSGPGLPGPADAGTLPRLDDSFQPVAAVVCSSAPLRRTDGGQDLVATESRAEDVTALVTALRLPDERLSGGACTLELYLPPFFVLLDARGRWVRPGLPADECGKVRSEVRNAVQGLRLTPVAGRPVREIESSEAAAAGCGQQWSDMVWVAGAGAGADSGRAAVVPPGFDGPEPVRLCVYRVPAEQQRTGKPAGDFVSGRYLSDEQWSGARREIESAAAAGPCTTPASRFAVLHFGAGQLYVELDGCRRLLAQAADGSQTLRRASPALLALLAR
ncbi:hypothetical protein [Actinoplanes sp. NPDC049599]|uniref:hypothetical protein n=1 Tax=Actinoplanes sp. NPDC049599 TaxID=3363903 RepID=UPI0037BCE0A3